MAAPVRERLRKGRAVVPALFHLEARNALLAAWRRGRFGEPEMSGHLAVLAALPVRTDASTQPATALELAVRHRLTVYDAVYLEVAKRRRGILASLDRALLRAAASEGIATIGPRS